MSEPYIKVNNFKNALSRLKEGIAKYNGTDDLAIEICHNIQEKYILAFVKLLENIEKRLN